MKAVGRVHLWLMEFATNEICESQFMRFVFFLSRDEDFNQIPMNLKIISTPISSPRMLADETLTLFNKSILYIMFFFFHSQSVHILPVPEISLLLFKVLTGLSLISSFTLSPQWNFLL